MTETDSAQSRFPWGSIKTTLLETKYTTPRSFRISVLPERVVIADGIETFVEHYVLVPPQVDVVSKITIHRADVIRDVFTPFINDGMNGAVLREALERIGNHTNTTEALLYYGVMCNVGIDALRPYVESKGKSWLGFSQKSLDDVIQEFGQQGVFGEGVIRPSEVNDTQPIVSDEPHRDAPSDTIIDPAGKTIRVSRLDDIVEMHVPPKAMSLFFPELLDSNVLLVKYLDHYLLSNHDIHNHAPRGRVHSSCATGDINRSFHCDCGFQLKEALKIMRDSADGGFVVYHNAEGRALYSLHLKMCCYDITRVDKVDTYVAMMQLGYDADHRDYTAAATLLQRAGVESITLLSNNPEKRARLQQAGVIINGQENIRLLTEEVPEMTRTYLAVKQTVGSHDLGLPV